MWGRRQGMVLSVPVKVDRDTGGPAEVPGSNAPKKRRPVTLRSSVARVIVRPGWARRTLAGVVALLACTSCGGNSGISAQSASNVIAQAVCTSEERCCTNPTSNYLSQCERYTTILMSPGTESQGTAHPNFNQDTADACLEAAQGYDCDGSLTEIDQLCQMAFTGNVALGQTCILDADCAQPSGSHAICAGSVCVQASLYGREGDTCDAQDVINHAFVCRFYEGLQCVRITGTTMGTCMKDAVLGESCADGQACVSGTYCDAFGTMICQQPGKAGEACGTATSIPPCGNGLVCTSAGTCGQNACG
jgi:hypothetical protein